MATVALQPMAESGQIGDLAEQGSHQLLDLRRAQRLELDAVGFARQARERRRQLFSLSAQRQRHALPRGRSCALQASE
jgi:hypothetical protein